MVPIPTRKQAIIFGVVLFLVVGTAVVFLVVQSLQPKVEIESVSTPTETILSVNYGSYESKFDAIQRHKINKAIEDYLEITDRDMKKVDGAVAREDTYTEELFEGKIPKVALIFDVKGIHTSYLMTLDGGPSYDIDILYVRCAEQAQQQNLATECVDVTE